MSKHSSVDNQGLDNAVQNEGSKPDVLKKQHGEKSADELALEKFKENDEGKNAQNDKGKHQRYSALIALFPSLLSRQSMSWRLVLSAIPCTQAHLC